MSVFADSRLETRFPSLPSGTWVSLRRPRWLRRCCVRPLELRSSNFVRNANPPTRRLIPEPVILLQCRKANFLRAVKLPKRLNRCTTAEQSDRSSFFYRDVNVAVCFSTNPVISIQKVRCSIFGAVNSCQTACIFICDFTNTHQLNFRQRRQCCEGRHPSS